MTKSCADKRRPCRWCNSPCEEHDGKGTRCPNGSGTAFDEQSEAALLIDRELFQFVLKDLE